MSEHYHNDVSQYDARLLTPRQVLRILQLIPAEWHFACENTIWEASRALYDEVDRLKQRDAGKPALDRRCAGASTSAAASTGE